MMEGPSVRRKALLASIVKSVRHGQGRHDSEWVQDLRSVLWSTIGKEATGEWHAFHLASAPTCGRELEGAGEHEPPPLNDLVRRGNHFDLLRDNVHSYLLWDGRTGMYIAQVLDAYEYWVPDEVIALWRLPKADHRKARELASGKPTLIFRIRPSQDGLPASGHPK